MTSEARWRDLYTGLEELLGTDRADTLMSRINLHPIDELATKAHVDQRFGEIDTRFGQVDQRLDRLEAEVGRLHDRLDHLQLTLVGGMMAIVTAIIIQTIFA